LVLVVREPLLRIVQVSSSAAHLLQRPLDGLLLSTLRELGGDLDTLVRQWIGHAAQAAHVAAPETLLAAQLADEMADRVADRVVQKAAGGRTGFTEGLAGRAGSSRFAGSAHEFVCSVAQQGGVHRALEGSVYRIDTDTLVVELQDAHKPADKPDAAAVLSLLGQAVQGVSEASDTVRLGSCLARWALRLTNLRQAAVYVVDDHGEWERVATAKAESGESGESPDTTEATAATAATDSLRGLELACAAHGALLAAQCHDPVQVQEDTRREPAELLPALPHPEHAVIHGALDLSRGRLASLHPAQLQTLQAQGVGAIVHVVVMRDGQPIARLFCTQGQPTRLAKRTRAALALLAEAAATRMAAIEHHASICVMQDLRALEQRLVAATSVEGDWRQALVREPQALLSRLRAHGALLLQDGEIFACGQVPRPPEQRLLAMWVASQDEQNMLACSNLEARNGTLAALAPAAAQVLAVRLHATSPDWLLWLRGTPANSDSASSSTLLPPWTNKDRATASAFGRVVADISMQVHAVRLLIAQSQMAQLLMAVQGSRQAMVVASAQSLLCQANPAFFSLLGRTDAATLTSEQLLACFTEPELAHRVMGQVRAEQRPWQGELALRIHDDKVRPVGVRAEPVPARDGSLLGFIFLIDDLSSQYEAARARQRLEDTLTRTERALRNAGQAELLGALLVNAGIAAMDISDDSLTGSAAGLLAELQASTERAAALFRLIHQD